jgi:uncharacterized membrane protein
MDQNEKLKELLQKLNDVDAQIQKSRQELNWLYHEIRKLSSEQKGIDFIPSRPYDPGKHRAQFSLENFVGLRLIHFIGIIALVIGLAIGVKFAIDKNLISPALRIVLAYIAAGILYFISYYLRGKYKLFSLILFGGSMATAYFTTYGAFAYYQFIPLIVAFAMMLIQAAFTVYYSIKYNSEELAVLALVGGYGIPFLVRGNAENWFGLLSYIFLINLAVSYLSFRKNWTTLIYLSFAISWMILLSGIYSRPDRVGVNVGLVFSILYFLLFSFNTTIYKFVHKHQLGLAQVCIVLLNILLLHFAMARLFRLESFEEVSGMTLTFGSVCLLIGYMAKMFNQPMLQRGLVMFGLFYIIIYIPMRFDHLTITFIWMLLAALLFVIGLWKKFKLLRLISIILFALTLVKLLVVDSIQFNAIEKIIAYILLGTILLVVSFLYQKFKDAIFKEDEE